MFYKNGPSSVVLSSTAENVAISDLQMPFTSGDVEVSDRIVTVILFIGSGDSKSLVTFLTEVPSAIGEVVG